MSKQCTKCLITKHLTEFTNGKNYKDGKSYYCKSCNVILSKNRYSSVNNKHNKLTKIYGISLHQYNMLLTKQNNVCAICKKDEAKIDKRTHQPRKLSVDHDHTNGKIRGLLCSLCNMAIGMMKDDFNIIVSAAEYIQEHKVI